MAPAAPAAARPWPAATRRQRAAGRRGCPLPYARAGRASPGAGLLASGLLLLTAGWSAAVLLSGQPLAAGPCNAAGGPARSFDPGQLTKQQLKQYLSGRGLPATGTKDELLQRARESAQAGPEPGEAADVAAVEGGQALEAGMEVEVFWEDAWYFATLLEVSFDGTTCGVRYDEGGDEEFHINVASRVRRPTPPWVKRGLRVEAEWEGDWYASRVLWVSPTGRSVTVKFEEGGDVETGVQVISRIRPLEGAEEEYAASRVSLDNLEVGQKLRGHVTTIREFGVFVDVGAEEDGLVPKARVSESFVDDLREVVSLGDEVDVWVSRTGEGGKLELAMVRDKVRARARRRGKRTQDLSGFVGLPADQWLTGHVTGFASFGMFVEAQPPDGGPPAKGVVHVSQIQAEGFLRKPSAAGHSEGDELQMRVLRVDEGKGRLDLTLLPPPKQEG